MKKSYIELLPALFDIFIAQYGTGDKKEKCFGSVRNKYVVAPIKTILNGGNVYKTGALCLHLEECTASLIICSSVPPEDKPIENILMEIRIGRVESSKNPYLLSFRRTTLMENLTDQHLIKLREIRGEIVAEMKKLGKSGQYEKAEEFATNEKTLH